MVAPGARVLHERYLQRITNNIKSSVCDIPPNGLKMAMSFLGNSTNTQEMFQRVAEYQDATAEEEGQFDKFAPPGLEKSPLSETSPLFSCVCAPYLRNVLPFSLHDLAIERGKLDEEKERCRKLQLENDRLLLEIEKLKKHSRA
eukprot:GEMP01099585.1.p1 GENE.GEMP01099585.1~~GEMP01099585.1.p1  ORF type:complete len:158 (+),score=29.95 GEMP01099585.1:43-474(+)